jgi:hypothetical protein
VTEREMQFISDLNKELIKDVVGQYVVLFPISSLKTRSHDVYQEAVQKFYDQPIKLDALVDATYHNETEITNFGIDNRYKLEVFVQWRDMVEKGVNVEIGDFFQYDGVMYEIVDKTFIKTIYGEAENKTGVKMVGVKARDGQIKAKMYGPTDISYSDPSAETWEWHQQRGEKNVDGEETGDVRELVRRGVLEPPLTGPKEVSLKGDGAKKVDSFYGDD